MAIPETNIESVAGFITEVDKFASMLGPHRHLSGWFRGHTDQNWELTHGTFRNGIPDNHLFIERHVYRDFQLWSAGIQQHHGVPTRLLDWTTNALVALYFAVDTNSPSNAAVFAMNAYAHGELDYIDIHNTTQKFRGLSVECFERSEAFRLRALYDPDLEAIWRSL